MTEETTVFVDGMIFDGVSAELREGCVRVTAGVITEVAGEPEPGDRVIDCRGRTIVPGSRCCRGPGWTEIGCLRNWLALAGAAGATAAAPAIMPAVSRPASHRYMHRACRAALKRY